MLRLKLLQQEPMPSSVMEGCGNTNETSLDTDSFLELKLLQDTADGDTATDDSPRMQINKSAGSAEGTQSGSLEPEMSPGLVSNK